MEEQEDLNFNMLKKFEILSSLDTKKLEVYIPQTSVTRRNTTFSRELRWAKVQSLLCVRTPSLLSLRLMRGV